MFPTRNVHYIWCSTMPNLFVFPPPSLQKEKVLVGRSWHSSEFHYKYILCRYGLNDLHDDNIEVYIATWISRLHNTSLSSIVMGILNICIYICLNLIDSTAGYLVSQLLAVINLSSLYDYDIADTAIYRLSIPLFITTSYCMVKVVL
jgi:hypothetical protein